MKNYNAGTMKNTVEKSKNSKRRVARSKRIEANARRKVAMDWDKIAQGTRYRKAAAKEFCRRTTFQLEEELFDGILLNLKGCKASAKSYNRQKRTLRRIVEKRQAQQAHRKVGRSADRLSYHMERQCIRYSMDKILRYQRCA